MDETLRSDPTDGVAVMEGTAPVEQGRAAAPLAVLGEITHRCNVPTAPTPWSWKGRRAN